MAAAKAAPAPEVEAEEEGGLRSQMWKHEAMVEWINENKDVDLDSMSAADIIAYAFAYRVEWRKSDTYRNLVDSYRSSAAQEAAAKKAEREAARAAKAAEKAAADAAAKAAPAPTKATKATKAKAPAAPTKATRATKASKASASDNPFD